MKKIITKAAKAHWLSTAAVIILLLLLSFIGIFSYRYGWQWLDSDHSAEMVLGKLLAQENRFVSANWYYSNELRVIYQTIFTMPLFKLLGHLDNWALIRSLNIVLNNLVLIASYIFMVKQLQIQVKWILITSVFLLMPLSWSYWNVITFGGYYIFFIAQFFIVLGLFFKLTSSKRISKTNIISVILISLLSVMLGVQGIRAFFGLYLPLLVTCMYMRYKNTYKNKFILIPGGLSFISYCIGYVINTMLQNKYHFFSFEDMKLEDIFNNLFPKLGQSLACLAGFFGYSARSQIFSVNGVFSIAAIIAALVLFTAVYKTIRKDKLHGKHQFMVLFFAVTVICNIAVFIISDKSITRRYFEPFMIFYIPLTAILFNYAGRINRVKRTAIVCGIILFVIGQGSLNYFNLKERDVNSARKDYIQYLLDNNLEYGFSTFWNSKVTTELSNGKIEVAGVEFVRSGRYPLRVQEYLNPVSFKDPLYHSGESFLLLTPSEWDSIRNRSRNINRSASPDYQDDNFVIIRYPSSQIIHNELLGN